MVNYSDSYLIRIKLTISPYCLLNVVSFFMIIIKTAWYYNSNIYEHFERGKGWKRINGRKIHSSFVKTKMTIILFVSLLLYFFFLPNELPEWPDKRLSVNKNRNDYFPSHDQFYFAFFPHGHYNCLCTLICIHLLFFFKIFVWKCYSTEKGSSWGTGCVRE